MARIRAVLRRASPDARKVVRFSDTDVDFERRIVTRKGEELKQHPRAAAVIYWDTLRRQVRLEGPVTRTSDRWASDVKPTKPRYAAAMARTSPRS